MCCPGLKSDIIWTRGEFLQPNPVSSRLKTRWAKKERTHNNLAFKAVFYISAALVCNDTGVYGNIQQYVMTHNDIVRSTSMLHIHVL